MSITNSESIKCLFTLEVSLFLIILFFIDMISHAYQTIYIPEYIYVCIYVVFMNMQSEHYDRLIWFKKILRIFNIAQVSIQKYQYECEEFKLSMLKRPHNVLGLKFLHSL